MNVMLSFPVAEERQVRSIDLKLNLADDIQAGEEGSLTSHSHNVNLWSDLLSCFRCQLLNLRETQFHAKTLLLREKFGSMKLWTAWPNPTFRIAYFSDYMKHWMWSRKEHKSKTKRNKNFEKLLNIRVPNVMKRDHQSNFFLQFVPSTSLQVNQFLFIHFSVVHLQISIVLPLTPASIRVQHLTFLLILSIRSTYICSLNSFISV